MKKWLLSAAACVMGLGVTTGGTLSEAGQLDPNQGLNIMNRSCTSCHNLRPIETQAMDSEGWIAIINAMIDNGAEVGMITWTRDELHERS